VPHDALTPFRRVFSPVSTQVRGSAWRPPPPLGREPALMRPSTTALVALATPLRGNPTMPRQSEFKIRYLRTIGAPFRQKSARRLALPQL
jgi:hypothetical protein